MGAGRGWRNGFGRGRHWVGIPIGSPALVAVGQATNTDGDLRSGLFPWLMAAAAMSMALLGLRLIAVHGPNVTRPVLIGGWWTTLAFLGIAGFFVAVSVGAALGIDEEEAGTLARLPVMAMAFGLVSMAPAVAVLAFGARRTVVLPRRGVWALWTATPLLVVLLVHGGWADEPAETVGVSVLLGVFALLWVVIGLSARPGNLPVIRKAGA